MKRVRRLSVAAFLALLWPLAQTVAQTTLPTDAPTDAYTTVLDWLAPPSSRVLGSVSSVDIDAAGGVWIAERCGQNSCVDRDDLSPILLFAANGTWRRGFGAGMFVWPHGIHLDRDGNIWVTDGRAGGAQGLQVFKFSPVGDLLMTLGEAGVAGDGPNQFSGPTDVVVAPNGDIFVGRSRTRFEQPSR